MKAIEVSVQEINTLYKKFSELYKENYNIIKNFIIEKYNIKDLFVFEFHFKKDDFYVLAANRLDEYNLRKFTITTDIFKADENVVNAYNILKEIFKVDVDLKILDVERKKHNLSLKIRNIQNTENIIRDWFLDIYTGDMDIIDKDLALKTANGSVKIKNYETYYKLKNYITFYDYQHKKDLLFDKEGKLWEQLHGVSLEEYDLKKVDWENKNIAGINITKNPEVQINFDKLVKDLTDANINGYNLKKYKLVGWNLTNADLRNTGATIDLASCNITKESKMYSGTLFDSDNKFIFFDRPMEIEEVEKLGIKVYKKI